MAPKRGLPEGLSIGGGKWTVGGFLACGEFGSVHTLMDTKSQTETSYVIKIVPLPKKTTKKQNSVPERNARILHYETIVYSCQLPEYQGETIPMLPGSSPGDPPAMGDIDGFRFLVMERMVAPLWDVIPTVLEERKSKTSIGPIGMQLLRCIQVFHENGQIVIDIKPENFMLSSNKKAAKRKTVSKVEEIASQIRLLDLGLLQQWKGVAGHRPDEGVSEVIGTPLYASLNLHNGHTPSRRDDLEALGYLIAELIIHIVASRNGKIYPRTSCSTPAYLPWAAATSDELMGKIKESEVSNPNSDFYTRMGGGNTAQTMKQYLDHIRNLKYKQAPDYGALSEILSQLEVNTDINDTDKKSNKSRATSRRPHNIVGAQLPPVEDINPMIEAHEENPKKIQRIIVIDEDDTVYEDAQYEQDTVYEDARGHENMDWELIADESTDEEDTDIADENNEVDVNLDSVRGIELLFEAGPCKGKKLILLENSNESLVIGKNPTSRKPAKLCALPKDSELDNIHATFELVIDKNLCSVHVTDHRSSAGTYINSEHLTRGKSGRAFRGDKVRVGQSVIRINNLKRKDLSKAVEPVVMPEKIVIKSSKTGTPKSKKLPDKVLKKSENIVRSNHETKVLKNKNAVAASPKKTVKAPTSTRKKLGARIVITAGPHSGDEFILEYGATESIKIGSKTSASKKSDSLVLQKDEGVEASHVELELKADKRIIQVKVKDLKSGAGTILNGRTVPSGKHQMAFVNDKITIGETTMEIKTI